MKETYAGLLKLYDQFIDPAGQNIEFEYGFHHTKLEELKEKYKLEVVAWKGDGRTKALKLLNWVSSNIYYNGSYDNHIELNALALLDYSFGNDEKKGINCRSLATILTECLLSIGIRARTVYLMPMSPYDLDNHVVTITYIMELDKWVMLDPTYNSYFIDNEGTMLSPWEVRYALANLGEIYVNDSITCRGYSDNIEEFKIEYIEYMTKNLFYMKSVLKNTFASESHSEYVCLCPKGYDMKRTMELNAQYKLDKYNNSAAINRWIKEPKNSPDRMNIICEKDFTRR